MTTQQAKDEVELRERIDTLVGAIQTGDMDAVKTIFAPHVVSFDMGIPLRHLGAEAKWKNWEEVFTLYQLPIEYEVRDLTVLVDGDLAVVFAVNRISGIVVTGDKNEHWVRWTAAWQRIDGRWMVVHDQVSVPIYFPEGRAALDLTP